MRISSEKSRNLVESSRKCREYIGDLFLVILNYIQCDSIRMVHEFSGISILYNSSVGLKDAKVHPTGPIQSINGVGIFFFYCIEQHSIIKSRFRLSAYFCETKWLSESYELIIIPMVIELSHPIFIVVHPYYIYKIISWVIKVCILHPIFPK